MEEKEFYKIPELCPVCMNPTSIEGDFLYCRSKSCPSKLSSMVHVWIAKLGLLHWGDALIASLTDPKTTKIKNVSDLYSLTVQDIVECCSGPKMAQKCYDILHSNKNVSLELLISALNIPNLGTSTSTDIVHAGYNTIDKILNLTEEELLKIQNVGPITAKQVYNGIQEKRDTILSLAGVLVIKGAVSGPLQGKSFCITGATSKPRKAIQKIIMDAGGIAKDSVGQGLSFLITNEDKSFNSSKMQKAAKYGTQVISEKEFYDMIKIVQV